MDPDREARNLALGRIAVGVAMLAAPGLANRAWVGRDAARPAVTVLSRALGAREVGLGAGLLRSLGGGATSRGWVEAGMLADGVDLLATLAAGPVLAKSSRVGIAVVAGSGLALGAWLARSLDGAPAPA